MQQVLTCIVVSFIALIVLFYLYKPQTGQCNVTTLHLRNSVWKSDGTIGDLFLGVSYFSPSDTVVFGDTKYDSNIIFSAVIDPVPKKGRCVAEIFLSNTLPSNYLKLATATSFAMVTADKMLVYEKNVELMPLTKK